MLLALLTACGPATLEVKAPDDGGLSADTASDDTADTAPDDTADPADTADSGEPVEPAPEAEWTVLVYLNGDNDLEQYAVVDANEMEVVGSTPEVNVLVQLDRANGYYRGEDDWTGARRYRIEADDDEGAIGSPVLEELGAVDSGSAQAVVDFVAWGVARYPARRYALVLWDHGDGWYFGPQDTTTKSISYDYSSGNDISVARGDLAELLEGVTAVTGRPLELLGMDACVMQSWEVAWVAQPHAQVYVASQDYEDVAGWAYDTTLADLVAEPTMEPAALGDAIALRFHEIPDSTLSVLDLERLPALTAALDTFAAAALEAGEADSLLSLATDAQGFDGNNSANHDLADLVGLFEQGTDDEATLAALAEVRVAFGEVVVANYNQGGRVSDALGLSIYSPKNGRVAGLYTQAAWSEATLWDDFVVGE